MDVVVASGAYLCNNCQSSFPTEQEYKAHYKSEFHRYNIKRKLVDLPPVTYEIFYQQFFEPKNKSRDTSQTSNLSCQICSKNFASKNTYNQHIESKKHKDNERNENRSPHHLHAQQISLDSNNKLPQSSHNNSTAYDACSCLFCCQQFSNIQKNLDHMNVHHGFFLCEKSFAIDIQKILLHLAAKINRDMECIYCKTSSFKSAEAVKNHMVDKGHCFMNQQDVYHDLVAYYDFSKAVLSAEDDFSLLERSEDDDNSNHESDWEEIAQADGEGQRQSQMKSEEKQQKKENSSLNASAQKSQSKKSKEDFEQDNEWENIDEKEVDNPVDNDRKRNSPQKQDHQRNQLQQQQQKHFYRLYKRSYMGLQLETNDLGELKLGNGKLLGHRQYRNYYNMYYRSLANVGQRLRDMLGPSGFQDVQLTLINQQQQAQQQAVDSQVGAVSQINQDAALYKYGPTKAKKTQKLTVKREQQNFVNLGLKKNKMQKFFRHQNPK